MKKEFYLKQARKNSLWILCLPVFCITIFVFTNCGNESIDDDTAVKIYVEKIIAEESYSFNADSVSAAKQKVFSKYNTTRQKFDAYLKSLEDKPEKLESFFKRADEYLLQLNKKGVVN